MKITRISLWRVPLTSHATYYMADGKTCGTAPGSLLNTCDLSGNVGPQIARDGPGLGIAPGMGVLGPPISVFS